MKSEVWPGWPLPWRRSGWLERPTKTRGSTDRERPAGEKSLTCQQFGPQDSGAVLIAPVHRCRPAEPGNPEKAATSRA